MHAWDAGLRLLRPVLKTLCEDLVTLDTSYAAGMVVKVSMATATTSFGADGCVVHPHAHLLGDDFAHPHHTSLGCVLNSCSCLLLFAACHCTLLAGYGLLHQHGCSTRCRS